MTTTKETAEAIITKFARIHAVALATSEAAGIAAALLRLRGEPIE
jgi:hypothetical protein